MKLQKHVSRFATSPTSRPDFIFQKENYSKSFFWNCHDFSSLGEEYSAKISGQGVGLALLGKNITGSEILKHHNEDTRFRSLSEDKPSP